MLGFKRSLTATILALAAVGLGSTSAFAGSDSGRTPFAVGDLTGAFCGPTIGPILLHAEVDNEYSKIYTLQDGTVKLQANGRLIADVTGNGHSLVFNSSGPGAAYFRPDGSVLVTGYGQVLFIGVNGEGLWLYNGRVLDDGTTGLIISRTGHATDICALLS